MNQVENELMHYGVLGMKWGKSSAGKAVKANIDRVKASSKMIGNSYAHPIMTSKAIKESQKNDSFGTKIRRSQFQTTKEIKDINSRVDAQVKAHVEKMNAKKLSAILDKTSKNKARAEQLVKQYGDKYSIIQNKDGSITLKDGVDTWKIS